MKILEFKKLGLLTLTPFLLGLTACNNEIENEPKDKPMVNQQYEQEIGKLDKQVDVLEGSWEDQSTSLNLSLETNQKTQAYLDELYGNVNATHKDLPEWQQMFDVLTLESAYKDGPNMVLGGSGEIRVNNFYRQHQQIEQQRVQLEKNTSDITGSRTIIDANVKDVKLHGDRLDTLASEIEELRKLVAEKNKANEDTIAAYNARVQEMETRLAVTESAFRTLNTELGGKVSDFQAILYGIRDQLRDYPLVDMYNDIQRLIGRVNEHQDRIADAEFKIATAQSEITALKNSVGIITSDVSKLNTNVGNTQGALDIFKQDVDTVLALDYATNGTPISRSLDNLTSELNDKGATIENLSQEVSVLNAGVQGLTGVPQKLKDLEKALNDLKEDLGVN